MASEEPGYDDVTSQASAVEEAPAPDQGDDMMKLKQRCQNSCGDVWQSAGLACDQAHPFAPHTWCGQEPYCQNDDHLWARCQQDASQAFGTCADMCDVIFGGSTNGGSHLPGNAPLVGDEAPAPDQTDDMRIVKSTCDRACESSFGTADANCINLFLAHWGEQLYQSCETAAHQDQFACWDVCQRVWGEHGCGNHCL